MVFRNFYICVNHPDNHLITYKEYFLFVLCLCVSLGTEPRPLCTWGRTSTIAPAPPQGFRSSVSFSDVNIHGVGSFTLLLLRATWSMLFWDLADRRTARTRPWLQWTTKTKHNLFILMHHKWVFYILNFILDYSVQAHRDTTTGCYWVCSLKPRWVC